MGSSFKEFESKCVTKEIDYVGGTVNFFHLTSRPTIIDSQLVFAQKYPKYIFTPNITKSEIQNIRKLHIKMLRILYSLIYVGMTANSKCCPNMKINLYTVSDTPKSQFSITEEIYQGKIEKNFQNYRPRKFLYRS